MNENFFKKKKKMFEILPRTYKSETEPHLEMAVNRGREW